MGFWSGAIKGATTGAIIGAAIFGGLALLSGSILLAIPAAIAGGLQWGFIGGLINGVIGALTPDPAQNVPPEVIAANGRTKGLPQPSQSYSVNEPSSPSVGASSSFVQRESDRRAAAAAMQQRNAKQNGVS